MGANETVIGAKISVSGLDDLEKAASLFDKLHAAAEKPMGGGGGDTGITKITQSIKEATVGAEKLTANMKNVGSVNNSGFTSINDNLSRSLATSERLGASVRSAGNSANSMASGAEKYSTAQTRAAEAVQRASTAQSRMSSTTAPAVNNAKQIESSATKTEGAWSKIKGSIKDSLAMFSVGMLGAQAVTGAVQGVKSAFKSGFDTIKERQQGQAMWATSIEDAHHNVTGANLSKQSSVANALMTQTAIKAGNDATEANSMAKQIYSSDAGSYSGNLSKTQSVVKSMFNIQDANALTQQEMERFKTAVGNIGDTGKMSNNIAKSLNFLDGKITRSMRSEYKEEKGKTLGKTKSGLWDYSQISAEMAYKALDKYGNGAGIGQASERYNSTLGGVIRAGKSAIDNGMADFETSFAEKINKAFGGKGGLIGKLAGIFTNSNNIKSVADAAANRLSGLAIEIGKFGKAAYGVAKDIAPYAKQFSGGFSKGFVAEMKEIGTGVKNAYNEIKGIGSGIAKKLQGVLPKNALSDLGGVAGKVTAVVVAFRAFTKLPGMSKVAGAVFKPAIELIGRLPLVGDFLKGIVEKVTGLKVTQQDTAASKMMTAADTMNVAADKMSTGSTTSAMESGAGGLNMTRMEKYQGAGKVSWSQNLINKGSALIGDTGTETGSRMAQNASWLTKLKGNSLIKIGSLGEKIGSSKLVTGLSSVTKGIGATGKFLSKGMPLMNAAFSGLDVLNTLSTTKAGSAARHKGVGGAIGGGVGATVGGAVGSLLGPLGTIGGGIAGQWVGDKVGSWLGGKVGSSSTKKTKKSASAASLANAAELKVAQQQQYKQLVGAGGASSIDMAKAQAKALSLAVSSKSKSAQYANAQAQASLQSGDYKSYQKQTATAAAETAKYYVDRAKTAKKQAASDKSQYSKYMSQAKKAYKDQRFGDGDMLRNKANKAQAKYKASTKTSNSATKKANAADKASVALGNKSAKSAKTGAAAEKKHAAAVKKVGDEADKSSKKVSKTGKASKKSAEVSTKALEKATKSAKKEYAKQTAALKKENKKQASQIKSANKAVKAAQTKATKDIAKADKAASKAMSKNYKTASKEISKAIKSGMKTAASDAKSGSKKIASNIKSGLKSVGKSAKSDFKSLTSAVKSGTNSAKSAAKSGGKAVANAVKSGLKTMNNGAKSQFSKLSSATKAGMAKVTTSVKSGMTKANTAMTSAFKKMTTSASSASAKISSVLGKIGTAASNAATKVTALQRAMANLKSKTITLSVNLKGKGSGKLATGTPGALGSFSHLAGGTPRWANNGGVKGGMYVVNDSKSSHWQEAFKTRSGMIGLFPRTRNLHVDLDDGTQVLNGDDTHRMFRLAKGTPNAKGSMTSGRGTAPVINITVTVGGSSSATQANDIANAIGEKFMSIIPQLEA